VSLEYILLGLLRKPRSGYGLKALFDQGIAHFWPAELSQIYVNLKRMTARGWLRDRVEPSERGPDRRVYTRTEAGCRALREWLAGEPQIGDERFSYLAQLFLLDELADLNATLAFLLRLRERLAQRQAALRAVEHAWREQEPGYPDALPLDQFHQQLTLDLGLHTAAARLTWCDEAVRRIQVRLEQEGDPAARGADSERGGQP
jgi:DNA-binding PadR family transcriptional regulator